MANIPPWETRTGMPSGSSFPRSVSSLFHYFTRMFTMFPKVKFVVIDEFSMVSSTMLYQIDRKLQELKQNGQPFGGVSLLLFGDPMQLKPVSSSPTSFVSDLTPNVILYQVCGNFIWMQPGIEEHSIRLA